MCIKYVISTNIRHLYGTSWINTWLWYFFGNECLTRVKRYVQKSNFPMKIGIEWKYEMSIKEPFTQYKSSAQANVNLITVLKDLVRLGIDWLQNWHETLLFRWQLSSDMIKYDKYRILNRNQITRIFKIKMSSPNKLMENCFRCE